MKALNWDGDGFLAYTKRLSQGRFCEVLKGATEVSTSFSGTIFYADKGLTPVKMTVENRFKMAVICIVTF